VTAILTGVLTDGGWNLIAGWVVPFAANVLLFTLLVLPSLRHVSLFHSLSVATGPVQALVMLAAAVIGGLILSALQDSLYRVLEGYLAWPYEIQRRRCEHHLIRKHLLQKRSRLASLSRREASVNRTLNEEQKKELEALRADPVLAKESRQRLVLTGWQNALLGNRLDRYPADDDQVAPTRLGNAIRSFETYGYDRYRLDAVVLWYSLTGVVPDQVRKQESASRATVDFFICTIYGHVLLLVSAICAIAVDPGNPARPLAALMLSIILAPMWYLRAVASTDDWAAAVHALVEVGRKPLAESLGLEMPESLEDERRMWQLVSLQVNRGYRDSNANINRFRRRPPGPPASEDDEELRVAFREELRLAHVLDMVRHLGERCLRLRPGLLVLGPDDGEDVVQVLRVHAPADGLGAQLRQTLPWETCQAGGREQGCVQRSRAAAATCKLP
jgi:hypothetical protein